jgi:hypothetical protein
VGKIIRVLFVVEKVQLLETAQDSLDFLLFRLGTELGLQLAATVRSPGEQAPGFLQQFFG